MTVPPEFRNTQVHFRRRTREWRQVGRLGSRIAVLLVLFFAGSQVRAQDIRIKAAFVFNFFKYAEWAVEPSSAPLTLCLANADNEIESSFSIMNGRVVNGRTLQVRRLTGVIDTAGCNALYIIDGSAKQVLDTIAQHRKSGLLTVGDADDFVGAGGMIGLVEHDGRLQFEVNIDAASRGNIKLSAQLLKLARNTR